MTASKKKKTTQKVTRPYRLKARRKLPKPDPTPSWDDAEIVHEFGISEGDEPAYRLVAPKGSAPGQEIALERRYKVSRGWVWIPANETRRTMLDLVMEIHSLKTENM